MKKFLILLTAILCLQATTSNAAKLEDFLDRKEVQKKIREVIIAQDLSFGVDLGNIDIINGINLSAKYNYEVEASYISKFYTRVDKWEVKTGIDVGQVVKELVDVPFSFSVNRNSSFLFVRQFDKKNDALAALPYTPLKLPLTANLALEHLKTGDFVSMPANLSVAVGLQVSSTLVSPVVLNASTGVYAIMSGEFTVQVFKLDETHVRPKLITKRGRDIGGNASVGASFKFFGIKILDTQIDHLFERDLAQIGYSYNPGAQFIVDYVFDLKDPEAQDAYNQILHSTYKFKDFIVADIADAKDLKDKLISSYEKADALFDADKGKDPKDRRVQRIFKGFNNYKGHTRHLKFSFLITRYTKDQTFTESKVTFVDKKEKDLEFYYPTFSKYIETHFGKWIFDLKDQTNQTNFGLIPRFNQENTKEKNPDLGLTFERKDRFFTRLEQKAVERFMLTQIPADIAKKIDLSQWRNGVTKLDSRIFFQLVLKGQGFTYLKNIPDEELKEKLLKYVEEKSKLHIVDENTDETTLEKFNDFLLGGNHFLHTKRLIHTAGSISKILKIADSEEMLKKLVGLNEFGVFDKIGVGFLISLLPQDKLEELVYLKLEMIGKNINPISAELGTLNYRVLYNELTQVQSRLSNRGYDLRLSEEDRNMGDLDIEALPK